jgi:hypothetical protein
MADQNKQSKEREDQEREDSNRSDGAGTPIYLTSNSTLQSPEEHAHDQSVDPRKDTTTDVSRDDLHDPNAGRMTGGEDGNNNQS